MTKKRFILSIIIGIGFYLWAILFCGHPLWLFSDLPSLLLAVIFPYIISSLVYTPREQVTFTREIFKGDGDKNLLKKAVQFYILYRRLLILSVILAILIGFIGILSNLEDVNSIGKNIAVALISPFYASFFLLIITEPLRGSAEKALLD